jgi:hypothetical protein
MTMHLFFSHSKGGKEQGERRPAKSSWLAFDFGHGWRRERGCGADNAGAHADMDRRGRLLCHRRHLPALRAHAPPPRQGAVRPLQAAGS